MRRIILPMPSKRDHGARLIAFARSMRKKPESVQEAIDRELAEKPPP